MEDMDEECRCVNDPVAKAKILNKYKGLKFHDEENNVRQVMSATELEWRRKNKKDTNSYTGWYLVSIDENNEEWPWEICQQVCDMLADSEQDPSIEVIRKADSDDA